MNFLDILKKLALLSFAALYLASYGCNAEQHIDTDNMHDDDHDHDDHVHEHPFAIVFEAQSGGKAVNCNDALSGYGPDGTHEVHINDLRFFVSNIQLHTTNGVTQVTLDTNDFQYTSEHDVYDYVALIDLTGNNSGTCVSTALGFPEGTARTNNVISGKATTDVVEKITFDVGISQHLMKHVISDHSAEDAPSPLAELHWSWAFGYRHFVFNFTTKDASGATGEGYVHIGSTGCGGDGVKALTDQEACDKINTAKVELIGFDLANSKVIINLDNVLAGVAFAEEVTDNVFAPNVNCHSGAMQAACTPVFANFGIDLDSGSSSATDNSVFTFE